MREVEPQNVDAARREVSLELGDPFVVRAVSPADDERRRVEPAHVSTFCCGGLAELGDLADPHCGQIRSDGVRLAPTPGLSRSKQDCPVVGQENRIVRVDGVGISWDVGISNEDLRSGVLELGSERGVLVMRARRIGGLEPAVLAPCRQIARIGFAHVHATQPTRLILDHARQFR